MRNKIARLLGVLHRPVSSSTHHATNQASLLIAAFTLAVAPASTFALSLPGPTVCLLIEVADLHALPDGVLTDSGSEADQQRYVQLARDARARIEATFGAVESKPILVFFSHPDGFGPFRLNAYGSTQFIGSRACVTVVSVAPPPS